MKTLKGIMMCIVAWSLFACDPHEWPEQPEQVGICLKLRYDTQFTVWNHLYDGKEVHEQGLGEAYDNRLSEGVMRYVIRTYPASGAREHIHEFVFTKEVATGYDHEVTLNVEPGEYRIMVWSDLIENEGNTPYYNATNFGEVTLQPHAANTDYRDAFCGAADASLVADVVERLPQTVEVPMGRMLAKFEVVSNDLKEFIEKQARSNEAVLSSTESLMRSVRLEDYSVVFYYVGFMPDTYSLFTDKPVDSSTDVMFRSTLSRLNDEEVSLGFDYVFVNGTESSVAVQIGIYDSEGGQVSLSDPIQIPLMRSRHTVLRGRFLTVEAGGSVAINPDYDGDHNLVFP